ncbi:MAG TPA: squalene/phytoene synthase family protein [Solirubrobacterales bacterium]|nr:squalene/phytoene synthase family protein [Solirubrobacterales bacterium]
MSAPAIEVSFAYRDCEAITRREAANFFYGIRLLPRSKRQAMSAAYAFARRVDDIGDGDLDPATKLAALDLERERLALLAADGALPLGDPVTVALAHACRRYRMPCDALEGLIDGVEQDVRETTYETFDDLVGYCRSVAGTIGRLCLAIFLDGHPPDEQAVGLADDLGVAMQLTNILRDIREDHDRGRVYLPLADLRRLGCEALPEVDPRAAAELISFEAERTRRWFERGLGLADRLDPRSAACLLAMTGIYRELLARIEAEPERVLRERVSLPVHEKAWLAVRSLVGGMA